jgi:hypothetical protein
LRGSTAVDGELKVVESAQPAPGVRLMVVEWSGGKVLVGLNGAAPPAVLDRAPALCAPGVEETQ